MTKKKGGGWRFELRVIITFLVFLFKYIRWRKAALCFHSAVGSYKPPPQKKTPPEPAAFCKGCRWVFALAQVAFLSSPSFSFLGLFSSQLYLWPPCSSFVAGKWSTTCWSVTLKTGRKTCRTTGHLRKANWLVHANEANDAQSRLMWGNDYYLFIYFFGLAGPICAARVEASRVPSSRRPTRPWEPRFNTMAKGAGSYRWRRTCLKPSSR